MTFHKQALDQLARSGVTERPKRPAAVAWCDEHGRYFFWKTGCTKDGKKQPTPTNEEVRAYYDWTKEQRG